MANLWDVKMGADAKGNIIASDWSDYGQAQSNIDQTKLRWGTASWPATPGSGGLAPQDSMYTFVATGTGAKRVLAKTQPLYGGAFKCNFLRAPSAPQQYFASEQIVDELAHAMNMDPVAFRRQNIDGTTDGRRTLAGGARRCDAGGRLEAEGRELQPADRQRPHRPRLRLRHVRLEPGRHRRRRPGEHEERQDRRRSTCTSHRTTGSRSGPQLVANQMSGATIQGLSRAMLEQPRSPRSGSRAWTGSPTRSCASTSRRR